MIQGKIDYSGTIFISIASYRDAELLPTLKDMLCQAIHPENLHIAVCWQDNEALEIFREADFTLQRRRRVEAYEIATFLFREARIDIISVHYYASRGAGWARSQAERLYENEQYFLQMDSHCRFIPGWDNEMIAMLQQLQLRSPLPIISAYPPPYIPGEKEEESKQDYVSRLIFREYDPQGIPMFTSATFEASEPQRGSYLAGGFLFTTGEFVTTVPNDPDIFFAGEEIAMAVRAFTHGYDVYHPHKPLIWHFYQREKHNKVWSDHSDDAKNQGSIEKAWWERDNISKKRVRIILGLDTESVDVLAPYTPGPSRTLRQFEYQAGICLRKSTVLPEVVGSEKINYFPVPPASDTEWLARHFACFKKSITLDILDDKNNQSEIESIHLNIYNVQNMLLYKRILTPLELEKLRAEENSQNIILQVEFKISSMVNKPAVIRLCSWSTLSGWGKVSEKAW